MSQYGGYNNQSSGPIFLVNFPGQAPQSVDNFTLRSWAQSKYIQPTTQVQDTRNGSIYTAAQIPGVFSDKEYVVALLLSIFLGTLGVDRFYTGQIGLGIGKLLTAGGCGIWWLIDAILYATRGVTDSNGLPLK